MKIVPILPLLALSCLAWGAARADDASSAAGSPGGAVTETKAGPARRTNENLHAVLWTQTSVEWQVSCRQAYNLATLKLADALADKTHSAATEQTGNLAKLKPAVIFDIDETVLDNSPFEARLIKQDKSWDTKIWHDWVQEAKADAIPGAQEFIAAARKQGVSVFFVSNRDKEDKGATMLNLKRAGFPVYADGSNVLLMDEQPGWGINKASRRELLAKKYRIIMLLGDDFNDFVSAAPKTLAERQALNLKYGAHWGKNWFLLPNPSYGSWERALYDFKSGLSDQEKLERKYNALRP